MPSDMGGAGGAGRGGRRKQEEAADRRATMRWEWEWVGKRRLGNKRKKTNVSF